MPWFYSDSFASHLMDINLIFLGAAIGVLIGLTGMGGGALMTPALIFFLGVKPTLAVGSDLVCNAVTKVFGAGAHLHQKAVNLQVVLYLALGSVPSSVLAVALVERIKLRAPTLVETYVAETLGFALIVVSVMLFCMTWFMTRTRATSPAIQTGLRSREKGLILLVGAVVGFLVGLTSVGSGSLIVSALVLLCPAIAPRVIVGTDVFHGAILVSAAGLAHYHAGNTQFALVANLLLGSIPGVLVGSRLSAVVSAEILRPILASALMVSGFQLIH